MPRIKLSASFIYLSDNKTIRNNSSFFNHYYSILDSIKWLVGIFKMNAAVDANIISYAAILINDSILDIAPVAYPQQWNTLLISRTDICKGFIIVISHQVTADNSGTMSYSGTDATNALIHPRCIDDRTFGDDCFFQRGAAYFSWGQHTGTGIDGLVIVK